MACSRDDSGAEPPPSQPERYQAVRIGALLPLTGVQAPTGVAARQLLAHRLEELNRRHSDSSYSFELEVVDTESDAAVAQLAFEELADDGVKVMIGPFSDAEIKAIRSLSNEKGVLVASPSSSAVVFSADDNILRFVPDDGVQAAAIVDLVRVSGVRSIAQVWRDDPGNAGLQAAVGAEFEALGGAMLEPLSYTADATEFEPVVQALSDEVVAALNVVGPANASTIGVVLASEDEVPQLLTLAAAAPGLRDVRWFGASGLARNPELVANPSAAEFATQVGLPSPIFGLDPAAKERWGPVVDRVQAQTGVRPDAVALAAYDALDVVVAAIVEIAFPAVEADEEDVRELRTEAISQSLILEGLTGPLKLNDFGDRATGVFDFWSVCPAPAGYEWRKTAVWTPGPDGFTGGTITGTATC